MAQNKTQPTDVPIGDFLATVSERRAEEARTLIEILRDITGDEPVMWGPSIIGFGSQEYQTSRGTEQMPGMAFSPRKANLTIYFMEGFEGYGEQLVALGPHKISSSCLYITRLERIDIDVLTQMLQSSFKFWDERSADN